MGSGRRGARALSCYLALAAWAVASVCAAQPDALRIGALDFFGTAGIDVAAVRAAIPVHVGDTIRWDRSSDLKSRVSAAVARVIGTPPTDVSTVCCDGSGRGMIYVGLPGTNARDLPHLPPPKGSSCLPAVAVGVYDRAGEALQKAIQAGDTAEDHSNGYALSHHPEYREAQLAMREYAVAHEEQVRSALGECPQAENRAAAAQLLGYANRSRAQIDGLVRAANDSDREVRNNGVRALWVLASSRSGADDAPIPARPFIAMLNSRTWEDRNKAGLLLSALVARTDRDDLAEIRRTSMNSLVEMARWHDPGHADPYRMLLGRLAGLDEARVKELVAAGEVEKIIAAAKRR